jgi:hypothetical protein
MDALLLSLFSLFFSVCIATHPQLYQEFASKLTLAARSDGALKP